MSDFSRKIIVRNAGTEPRYLLGKVIAPTETMQYGFFAFNSMIIDTTILEDIEAGDLVINDGERDLNSGEGAAYITNVPLRQSVEDGTIPTPASGMYAITLNSSGPAYDDGTISQTYDAANQKIDQIVGQPIVENLANVDTSNVGTAQSFSLVKVEADSEWKPLTPKETPSPVGAVVDFTTDTVLDETNINDVLNFTGTVPTSLTLFDPSTILNDITITIRNEGTEDITVVDPAGGAANAAANCIDGRVGTRAINNAVIKPDASATLFNKGNEWFVSTDTVNTTSRVRDLEISLGYLVSEIRTENTSTVTTIDPALANNWLMIADADAQLNIILSSNPDNLTYITFSLSIVQDPTGGHSIVFLSDLNIKWDQNTTIQIPRGPGSVARMDVTTYDAGGTWFAAATMVYDSAADPTGNANMEDRDTTRRTIGLDPTEIGLEIISNQVIETGNLFYRILANSTASTAAELQVFVDGQERYANTTPSFFEDQLVTQDVPIDASWQVLVGSVIQIFFRETSGALTIEVKGDVQESIMKITDIIEGTPPPPRIGVEDTNDHLLTGTNADIGLNWTNDTGDGFLTAEAYVGMTVEATGATSAIDYDILVDDVVRYSANVGSIFDAQRITDQTSVDESWQVKSDSVVKVQAREQTGNPAVNMSVMGTITKSFLEFDTIVPGDPSTGGGPLEDTNDTDVLLPTSTDVEILSITSDQAVSAGTCDFTVTGSSNFTSGCIVIITVDDVERYNNTFSSIFNATEMSETGLDVSGWGIANASVIKLTCRESSGNPGVTMTIVGSQVESIITITPS